MAKDVKLSLIIEKDRVLHRRIVKAANELDAIESFQEFHKRNLEGFEQEIGRILMEEEKLP